MEVRVIDPKSESSENAGRVLGTVIRVVPSPKRPPAPNPYRFIVKRALRSESIHHAEGIRGEVQGSESVKAHRQNGLPTEMNPSDEDVHVPETFCSESSHHAGEVGHRQSSHRLSVVAETVLDGPPATNHQNAEVAGHKLFLLRKTNCGEGISFPSVQNSPSRHPAPNSNEQNAGNSRKSVPPRLESKSPCASRSSKPSEVIVGRHKFFSPFRRLFSYIWSKSAYNDPTREMTNWGWRRKT